MNALWLVVVLGGAAVLVLTAIVVVLGRLLRAHDRSKIDWPLDAYVEERRRWVQALNKGK